MQEWKCEAQEQEKKNRDFQKAINKLQLEKNVKIKRLTDEKDSLEACVSFFKKHSGIIGIIALVGFIFANNAVLDDLKAIQEWLLIAMVVVIMISGVAMMILEKRKKAIYNSIVEYGKCMCFFLVYGIAILISFARFIPGNIFKIYIVIELILGVVVYRYWKKEG